MHVNSRTGRYLGPLLAVFLFGGTMGGCTVLKKAAGMLLSHRQVVQIETVPPEVDPEYVREAEELVSLIFAETDERASGLVSDLRPYLFWIVGALLGGGPLVAYKMRKRK